MNTGNWQSAQEILSEIKDAISSSPSNPGVAMWLWDNKLDFAIPIFPPFQKIEPGQRIPVADPRLSEVRLDAENLRKALASGDSLRIDELLTSTSEKVRALSLD